LRARGKEEEVAVAQGRVGLARGGVVGEPSRLRFLVERGGAMGGTVFGRLTTGVGGRPIGSGDDNI